MKVVVAAGGTGGHFYPGVSVARELIDRGHRVSFIARRGDSVVLPALEREGIPFRTISAAGLRRQVHAGAAVTAAKLAWGTGEAFRAFHDDRPDVLLVMGGYLSVPPAVAARFRGIPVVLHEQNVVPGLANRLLARLAKKIAVSFEQSRSVFGEKAVVTGNPIRAEFQSLPPKEEALARFGLSPGRITVLVFGGSLGARALNQLVLDALAGAGDLASLVQWVHFSGKAAVEDVKSAYARLPFFHHAAAFCHDMPAAYAAADFVLCRSGASTVSELVGVRKPALLVPYPHATNDHQAENARVLFEAGAADMVRESDLSAAGIREWVRGKVLNAPVREAMIRAYDSLEIQPFEAAALIADVVEKAGQSAK